MVNIYKISGESNSKTSHLESNSSELLFYYLSLDIYACSQNSIICARVWTMQHFLKELKVTGAGVPVT